MNVVLEYTYLDLSDLGTYPAYPSSFGEVTVLLEFGFMQIFITLIPYAIDLLW
ncbi:hypothetical protein M405DRAFT_819994 [Rhizopogon salebrosus TDB-379]|nr:hypothetical protein M405DRAFT_819994 [Rhizopogon salebrosus TDB-379]